jgi:hypothetical protein
MEFYFLLQVSVLMGPSSGSYDTSRVIELPIYQFFIKRFVHYNLNYSSDYNISIKMKIIQAYLGYVLEKTWTVLY